MNLRFIQALIAAIATILPMAALAQAYPSRPIRIIVPFPPGGGMDTVVRQMAQEMTKGLGQPIIVDNKPGASTVIGVDAAAKSAPDGYTLVGIAPSFTANHTLVAKLPYDSLRNFQPISLLVRTSSVLVGKPSLAPRDLRELVAWVKTHPGQLSYGTTGNGSGHHLASESLKMMAGIDMVHVPYKGEVPAMTDVMGGQLELAMVNLPTALPHIRTGKLKAFGITSRQRTPFAADIPTIAEQGFPSYEADNWFGLIAPAGVPDQIVARLNREVVRALATLELRKSLQDRGFDPASSTPEELGAIIRSEIERYATVIKAANIKLD